MASFKKVKAKNKKGYTWKVTVEAGRDPRTGKRKQIVRRGFTTKTEAEAAVTQIQHELNNKQFINDSKLTLSEYMDQWLDLYGKRKLRETTFDSYKRAIDYRLLPQMGDVQLSLITAPLCQKYINELLDEGLSERYVEYISVILHGALKKAVEWELLTRNPMEKVDIPRGRRRKHVTWSTDEIERFLHFAKYENLNYYAVFLTFIYTGLRRGELLGLQWGDIDLDDECINVNRNLIYDQKGFRFGELKNESSYRTIKIDDYVTNEIRQHKTKQSEFKLILGKEYDKNYNLVFCREDGRPIYPRTLTTIFNRLIKKADVTKIRLHDLRHTHASLMLEAGNSLKEVQDRLGHRSIKTTGDIYAHVTDNMKNESAQKFGNYLRKNI
ncbi:tyrosine-type recombinase/integrase [Halobacillus sp. Cin3]|uniref:site-specific integrase n=1 Tax=Halobacillus sp. Cin3 TaxID=2928441 RepID=UPI00248D78CC|nr:tyrosine-type recombinase/integrase [Halobacillus sp. Cin3]